MQKLVMLFFASSGFGQDSDRPLLAAAFDHNKRFRFRGIKHGDGFLDVHDGIQHDIPIMKDALETARGIDLRRVRVSHQCQPDVAAGVVDRRHPGLRSQRKLAAELFDRHVGAHGGNVRPHQAPHREIANPAHVGGAADGLSAQVEPPGRERVTEQFAGDLGRDDDRGQNRGGEPEIAGGFQRDECHRQRSADHRRRQRAHADNCIDVGIKVETRPDRVNAGREQAAAERAEKQRGEKQSAAKAAAERYHGRKRFQHEHGCNHRQRH